MTRSDVCRTASFEEDAARFVPRSFSVDDDAIAIEDEPAVHGDQRRECDKCPTIRPIRDGQGLGRSIGFVAYDEDLADRIRDLLAGQENVTERKMFGGLAFLVNGNMAIAASGQGGILVRSDPKKAVPAGAETAIMRDRPMEGWLRVADDILKTKAQLSKWTRIGTAYARSLPPKQ